MSQFSCVTSKVGPKRRTRRTGNHLKIPLSLPDIPSDSAAPRPVPRRVSFFRISHDKNQTKPRFLKSRDCLVIRFELLKKQQGVEEVSWVMRRVGSAVVVAEAPVHSVPASSVHCQCFLRLFFSGRRNCLNR